MAIHMLLSFTLVIKSKSLFSIERVIFMLSNYEGSFYGESNNDEGFNPSTCGINFATCTYNDGSCGVNNISCLKNDSSCNILWE